MDIPLSRKRRCVWKKYYKNIDPATNSVGIVWDDTYSKDDILTEQTMYVVKGTPIKLILGSRDVIHDVGLTHFRLKMDAVPGIPTTMWFTPLYTTKEMREKTGNQISVMKFLVIKCAVMVTTL